MTPDIVANAIVAALSAGAVAGATDTAKSAIADAYQGLKSLIKKKSGDESEAAKAIERLEAKPDSDARNRLLAEELKTVDITSDQPVSGGIQTDQHGVAHQPCRSATSHRAARKRQPSRRYSFHRISIKSLKTMKSMLLAGYRLSGFGEERCAHLWLQPGQRG